MGATVNNSIYTVTTFYKSDFTKDRAKELVTELSSDERELLLSILNKTFDPSVTNAEDLSAKPLSIKVKDDTGSFLPIALVKDAELSSFGKTMMNVWRALKDFFGTRISDAKILKEMDKFSKNAALEKMNALDDEFLEELLEENTYDFNSEVASLEQTNNYNLDLTPSHLGLIFMNDYSVLKSAIGNQMVEALANGGTKEEFKVPSRNYYTLFITNKIKNEFFSDNEIFTVKNLVTKVQNIGFENLSVIQKNTVESFFHGYAFFYPE